MSFELRSVRIAWLRHFFVDLLRLNLQNLLKYFVWLTLTFLTIAHKAIEHELVDSSLPRGHNSERLRRAQPVSMVYFAVW